jgi:hypothetical protein
MGQGLVSKGSDLEPDCIGKVIIMVLCMGKPYAVTIDKNA